MVAKITMIKHLPGIIILGTAALISLFVFLVGTQNAMAVSFDYYSYVENPPVSNHAPLPEHITMFFKGKFGEVHLRMPVELAKESLNTLQSSLSVKGIESKAVEFIIEKYELVSEHRIVPLYPQNFDREIKGGISTAQVLTKLHESIYETNYTGKYKNKGPNFTRFEFLVNDYQQPFERLTLNFRVKIMHQGQEEIVENSIRLYRGRYTFGFFEYLKKQFYE